MTRGHLTLAIAILAEVMATSALRASEGFRRPGPIDGAAVLGISLIVAGAVVRQVFSRSGAP